ncbi:hypothetical protein POX_e07300 [Penicillium oxalicum]|uniref:hypothetical protein n=1 Tax=Penicillium oxalicum TaxID=69781 RepID=UPI0020B6CF54|nr:hypothetical protein POX_e07300 [Penicillium oxalicum]KAI2789270.1 hypothetical protein POX_e07300 [Penicillium oxalicum]
MERLPDGVTRDGDQDNLEAPVPIPSPVKVDLPPNSTWTNESGHLELSTFFDPSKPNLSRDFGIDGLQPVIRAMGHDTFLLRDASGNFYQWSISDGAMWQLLGLEDLDEAVHSIMRDSGILSKTQIWNLERSEG